MEMGCQCGRITEPAWLVIVAYTEYRWGLGVDVAKHSAAFPVLPVEIRSLLPV